MVAGKIASPATFPSCAREIVEQIVDGLLHRHRSEIGDVASRTPAAADVGAQGDRLPIRDVDRDAYGPARTRLPTRCAAKCSLADFRRYFDPKFRADVAGAVAAHVGPRQRTTSARYRLSPAPLAARCPCAGNAAATNAIAIRGRARRSSCSYSSVDQILQGIYRARVMRLAEPKDGLLSGARDFSRFSRCRGACPPLRATCSSGRARKSPGS